MSYARLAPDSDVYVYEDVRGGYTCENCPRTRWAPDSDNPQFRCTTAGEMVDHLMEHRARGERVPDDAIEVLRAETERAALNNEPVDE